jgi:hypothetical protein
MTTTLSINHTSMMALDVECCYATFRDLPIIMVNVIMLSVIVLTAIMLNVMAPIFKFCFESEL